MVTNLSIKNFGPLGNLEWTGLSKINLVIGVNGSGKTYVLKAMYTALKTIEEYRRGDEKRNAAEILADKLYWTYQVDKIGDLVTKGSTGMLQCSVTLDKLSFSYKFGKDTTKQINSLENQLSPRDSNSIFLPAKEVLSIQQIILKSREQDIVFGFDDTYLDLARALRLSSKQGRNYKQFADSRQKLDTILGGKMEFDTGSNRWQFVNNQNQKFALGVTAEGVKKIAILDTLLSNRYLDAKSIIFIDEPESALHPTAITQLLDIITALSDVGIQFFLATHSYFVIKKLLLIAQKSQTSIPVLSISNKGFEFADLLDGMPDNPIIAESIRLYKEEVGWVLQGD